MLFLSDAILDYLFLNLWYWTSLRKSLLISISLHCLHLLYAVHVTNKLNLGLQESQALLTLSNPQYWQHCNRGEEERKLWERTNILMMEHKIITCSGESLTWLETLSTVPASPANLQYKAPRTTTKWMQIQNPTLHVTNTNEPALAGEGDVSFRLKSPVPFSPHGNIHIIPLWGGGEHYSASGRTPLWGFTVLIC